MASLGSAARFSLDISSLVKKTSTLLESMDPVMPAVAVAQEFLEWANEGSGRSTRSPPIKTGKLRGSSSAHINGVYVGGYEDQPATYRDRGNKSSAVADGIFEIVWTWSAPYAATMHMWQGGWGHRTRQQLDAGNEWVTINLMANAENIVGLFGRLLNPAYTKFLRTQYGIAKRMSGTIGKGVEPRWLRYLW